MKRLILTCVACMLLGLFIITINAQSTNVNVMSFGYWAQRQPPNLTNIISVSTKTWTACALRDDGTVVQWGGEATEWPPSQMHPLPNGVNNVIDISVGDSAVRALKADGTVFEWGFTYKNDKLTQYASTIPGLSNIVAIATGSTIEQFNLFTSLALDINGRVMGGDYIVTNAVAISANGGNLECKQSLALLADSTVVGLLVDQGTSVPIGLSNVIAISAGYDHSLALKNDGTVVAWGNNTKGQCNVPSNLTSVASVSAGAYFSLALKSNGTVVAWGDNTEGKCNIPIDLPVIQMVSAGYNGWLAVVSPTQAGSPPKIISQSGDRTVGVGSSAVLWVMALGFKPFTYQWYFGTNQIVGATNQQLFLSNLQTPQSGQYLVTVSNGAGTTSSLPATLNVLPTLGISMVPAIEISGTIGYSYYLQYINSYGPATQWVNIKMINFTNSHELYFDTSAVGQPARFYRLIQVP